MPRCQVLELEKIIKICNLRSLGPCGVKAGGTKLRGCDPNYLTNPMSTFISYELLFLKKTSSLIFFGHGA